MTDTDPIDRLKSLEEKARRKREEDAKRNRGRFPVLKDPIIKEICETFNGKVVAVRNNKGDNMGKW